MERASERHLKWAQYFAAESRISANHVRRHPAFAPHDHEFMEIVLIAAGRCLHRTALGARPASAGDVFIFRPGAWHAYEDVRGLEIYNCCFDSALLAREMAWLIDHPTLGPMLWSMPLAPARKGLVEMRLIGRDRQRGRALLETLSHLSHARAMESFTDRLGVLLQILSLLGRCLRRMENHAKALRPEASSPLEPGLHSTVTNAIRLMEEHPEEAWSLRLLAQRVHVERTYFVRLFHRAIGIPPMAYLARRRVEMATGLLRRTHLSIGEIGGMVGWPDANHFNRRFRAIIGVTPSLYRQRMRTQAQLDAEMR